MKIAHLCLSCFYNDGRAYQENELVRQHVLDGHDVLVVASTERIDPDGRLSYSAPGDYQGADGARVIRLPYRLGPAKLARKLRAHPGVYRHLEEFRPDAILFHGTCGWEVATAARYARDNPGVLFYIDSHEDWNNSAHGFVSREILHKLYYRFCLARAAATAKKILCISTETIDFVEEVYRVPRSRLEFFPLGGQLVREPDYTAKRREARMQLGVTDDTIVFLQSGKQTRRKKLIESLEAFKAAAPAHARLLVVGNLDDEIKERALALFAADPRTTFLGWKSADELTGLLCAADVYLQPGTQSVTMQHSLCCHCAVILDDAPSHRVYMDGNGWLINGGTSLEAAIAGTATADLQRMRDQSFAVARAMLDYGTLSKRVLRAEV
jgi:1,2-diacylglycerol 3-alpha-glucosyltransferase